MMQIFLYIASRLAYMKHLFCLQLILIFPYLLQVRSADKLSFGLNVLRPTLATAFPTSYRMKTVFVLVEFENSGMMHVHSTSFPVLLS